MAEQAFLTAQFISLLILSALVVILETPKTKGD